MKQGSKRLTSIILALLFLVGALIVFFELLQPAYGDLETKRATQLSTANLLANEQTTAQAVQKLIAQYSTSSPSIASLSLAMPPAPDAAGAVAQLYGIAQNDNITVRAVNITGTAVKTAAQPAQNGASATAQVIRPFNTISFSFGGSGSYESLKAFLSDLETNVRIFDVTSLSVQGAAPSAPGGRGASFSQDFFSFNFSVTAYYQM